jgi:hypothetical protein
MLDGADRLALHVLLHLYGTSSMTEPRSGSEIGGAFRLRGSAPRRQESAGVGEHAPGRLEGRGAESESFQVVATLVAKR